MKVLWVIAAVLGVVFWCLVLAGKPLRSGFSIKASPNYPAIVVTNVPPVEKHQH